MSTIAIVDVLEFSPVAKDGTTKLVRPVDITPEDVQPQIEAQLYAAITAHPGRPGSPPPQRLILPPPTGNCTIKAKPASSSSRCDPVRPLGRIDRRHANRGTGTRFIAQGVCRPPGLGQRRRRTTTPDHRGSGTSSAISGPVPRLVRPLALNGALPRRDHEILALRTAYRCQSDFEWNEHAGYAKAAGLDADEIAKTKSPPDSWEGPTGSSST
jgi:hypothetical protein